MNVVVRLQSLRCRSMASARSVLRICEISRSPATVAVSRLMAVAISSSVRVNPWLLEGGGEVTAVGGCFAGSDLTERCHHRYAAISSGLRHVEFEQES